MARRGRAKRRRDDSDDDEERQLPVSPDAPRDELANAAPAGLESELDEELAPVDGDEDDAGEEDAPAEGDAPGTPKGDPKRKRVLGAGTPTTAQEEAELARRRRRRQSLVFQKRRQSLTPSTRATGGNDDGEQPQSRQYISDMYSTIIKMSSENKINIKNTWSLHLIDHMEDILANPQQERVGAVEDPDTFNFQKASCTLDASVKIYSYRVDDTWTSSYKILENLSRSGAEKRADNDEGGEDDEEGEGGEDGEDGAQRRTKKKTRKPASAARTIEKNLNNITLKSYEIDFEPDPLFHKMSQTFDEGGAKGMLLANLGVYDGAKILLNSADVRLSTRKTIEKKKETPADEEEAPKEDEPVKSPKPSKIDIAALGKLTCFSKDVTTVAVCPPMGRLYDQIEELRDPTATQSKIVLKKSMLNLTARRPKSSDEETNVPSTPIPEETFPVVASGDNGDVDAEMEDASELPPAEETKADDSHENDGDDDDDENNEPNDYGFDYGGGDDMDVEMEDADAATGVPDADTSVLVDEAPANASALEVDVHDDEPVTERHIDPVTNLSEGRQPIVVKSAADYFRARMEDDAVKNEEDMAYSQLIETALMRSVILEAEGTEEVSDRNDYSYFDTKMMKNWAGPSHLKFKQTRRIPASFFAFVDEQEEGNGTAPTKRGRKPQQRKSAVLVSEKKSMVVDFMSPDVPDLAKLLKAPKGAGSTTLSKLAVKRQMQKSAELVFPVDAHIESKIFFRHFLKPRLQLFHRPLTPSRGMEADDTAAPSASDPGLENADNLAYEDGGNDFGVGGFSDDDESDNEIDQREGSTGFFSSTNLITAERVVEKVDVHYERVAKRVDVKKLKTSLWTHLESETALLGKRKSRQNDAVEPDPERSDEDESSHNIEPTTFENVVHGIAEKVPSNVTVSFYFICMLHLANEKGLRLTGQDDLSDFAIKKEEPLMRN